MKLLQHGDGIPVNSEVTLLPSNLVCTKRGLDISIFYQTLGAPQSNTERRARRLNCKAVANIRKDKTPMAEDTFNVNACGYGTMVSAPKTNARKLYTHQE
jgi:hypothetical protein